MKTEVRARTPWTIGNLGKHLAQMEKKGWITPQEAFEQRAWRARISKPRKKRYPIAKSANH